MNNIEYILDEATKLLESIKIKGHFNSSNSDISIEFGDSQLTDKESVQQFCVTCLTKDGRLNRMIDLDFSNMGGCLVFQYVGENYWVILGGEKVVSFQVRLFLKQLWVLQQLKEESPVEKSPSSVVVVEAKKDSVNSTKGKLNFHMPEITEFDTNSTIEWDADDDISLVSSLKLRKKQLVALYKDIRKADFNNIFENFFIYSYKNIWQSDYFYWYKKLNDFSYFFFVKSNAPKLEPVNHYSTLSTFINNAESLEYKTLFKDIKNLVQGFNMSFDEDQEQKDDMIGVFCLDEKAKKISYCANGIYLSKIDERGKLVVEKVRTEGSGQEVELKNKERYYAFTEELLPYIEDGENDEKKIEKILNQLNSQKDLSKEFVGEYFSKLSEDSEVNPDYLMCCLEVK